MNKEKQKISFLTKTLRVIPGLLTWITLLSPIWLGLIWPTGIVFVLTFLAIFWVYRAIAHTVGVTIGYFKYKRELDVDWLKKCEALEGFDDLQHLILIPTVNESYEVLHHTLEGIAQSKYPKDKVLLAITCEERWSAEVKKNLE
jgi:hypothetical protein